MKLRKQSNSYDSTLIFDLDSSDYDAEVLKILESGYYDCVNDEDIKLYPKSYNNIRFTLIGNNICKNINKSFSFAEVATRNKKMRTALSGFRPFLRPTSRFHLIKKEYKSDIGNGTYFRYSLVHRYTLLNIKYFSDLFFEIYGFKIHLYPHITLMVGSNSPSEPKALYGVGLDTYHYFKSNKIKKVNQKKFFMDN